MNHLKKTGNHLHERPMLASGNRLEDLRRIASKEAGSTVKENPNILAFFVYGSVARGNPTPSSDIDTISVVEPPPSASLSYAVVKRNGILISKEFHPRSSYECIENLSHRVYDAWILHDPTNFFFEIRRKLRGYFYTREAKRKRIRIQLKLAEHDLEKSRNSTVRA